MLRIEDGSVFESVPSCTITTTGSANASTSGCGGGGQDFVENVSITGGNINGAFWYPQTYWHSYAVYVCTDKTAKAIEILKKLEAEKVMKVGSVNRFIDLVEMIVQTL